VRGKYEGSKRRKGTAVKFILGYGVVGTMLLGVLSVAPAAEPDVLGGQGILVHESERISWRFCEARSVLSTN
jgi:hypothetical protein